MRVLVPIEVVGEVDVDRVVARLGRELSSVPSSSAVCRRLAVAVRRAEREGNAWPILALVTARCRDVADPDRDVWSRLAAVLDLPAGAAPTTGGRP